MPVGAHPIGLPIAHRIVPPQSVARGYEDAFIASPECLVTTKRIEVSQGFVDQEHGFGRLAFVFHLNGQRIVDISGLGKRHLNGPSFSVHYLPSGATKKSTWMTKDRETAVVIGFWPHTPPQVVSKLLRQVPEIQRLLPICESKPMWLERPLTIEMEQAARFILSPRVHPALFPDILMNKVNELLCLGIDALMSSPHAERLNTVQAKLQQARQIIETNLRDVPSAAELARRVDLPASTFSVEFQQEIDISLSDFKLQLQMKKAHHLLVTTGLPLKSVSYEVGYHHASNFCTAFRRYFGRTPTEVRNAASR